MKTEMIATISVLNLASLLDYIQTITKSKFRVTDLSEDAFSFACEDAIIRTANRYDQAEYKINYNTGMITSCNENDEHYNTVILLNIRTCWIQHFATIKVSQIHFDFLRLLAGADLGLTSEWIINKCIETNDAVAIQLLLTNKNIRYDDIVRVITSGVKFSNNIVFQSIIERFVNENPQFLALCKCSYSDSVFADMLLEAIKEKVSNK